MASSPAPAETVIWTDAPRVALARRVAARLDPVRVIGVGGPRRSDIAALAEQLAVDSHDDLRQMLTARPADLLLLIANTAAKRDDVQHALAEGIDVVAVEPIAAQVESVIAESPAAGRCGRLTQAPLWRLSPAWLSAAQPQQALGRIRSVSADVLAPPDCGSLFARLAGALDTVVHLLGMPDGIDAALSSTLAGPPEDLRGLTGSVTAHLRYDRHAVAVVHVSDRASVWRRSLTAVGDEGTLIIGDHTYRLIGTGDAAIDEALDLRPADPAELIAAQCRWLVDHRSPLEPVDRQRVIACCETALLSCRTGQCESPQTLLRLRAG